MSGDSVRRSRALTALNGAISLIAVLLIVQMWLLTATLEAFLAGYEDTAVPGAIASGLLFAGAFGLYRLMSRVDRATRLGSLEKKDSA